MPATRSFIPFSSSTSLNTPTDELSACTRGVIGYGRPSSAGGLRRVEGMKAGISASGPDGGRQPPRGSAGLTWAIAAILLAVIFAAAGCPPPRQRDKDQQTGMGPRSDTVVFTADGQRLE
jgi:hypothetical protein